MNQALQELLKHCHRRRYSNHTDILKPGDEGNVLYYVLEGSLSVRMIVDEEELVLDYVNRREFIGETGLFTGPTKIGVTIRTKEPTILAEIGYNRLDELLRVDLKDYAIDILKELGSQISIRLKSSVRRISDLTFLDSTGRIANVLINLSRSPQAMTHPEGMQINITRQELGKLAGCSRELAGKILKELEDRELIKAHGKTIVVLGTR